jgi:transcription elongation factor/antiterminator RfaH
MLFAAFVPRKQLASLCGSSFNSLDDVSFHSTFLLRGSTDALTNTGFKEWEGQYWPTAANIDCRYQQTFKCLHTLWIFGLLRDPVGLFCQIIRVKKETLSPAPEKSLGIPTTNHDHFVGQAWYSTCSSNKSASPLKIGKSEMNSKRWYVVYSKPHGEERAQFHFRLKGVEHFFPRLLLPGSRRKPNRIISLFPNYMFVRIALSEDYHHVVWSPGVKYLVGFGGHPAPLDDEVVEFFMKQANPEGIIPARLNLEIGQVVRICDGPFAGLVGIIQNPPDAKGRVKLLLNLLKRQVAAETPATSIEAVWGLATEIGSKVPN